MESELVEASKPNGATRKHICPSDRSTDCPSITDEAGLPETAHVSGPDDDGGGQERWFNVDQKGSKNLFDAVSACS